MNLSNPVLVRLALLLAIPVLVVALANWLLRSHGGFLRGWSGAVFIGLCWVATLVLIAQRVAG